MNKLLWLIKQLLPLDYYSRYEKDGKKMISTWKMLFGKCYNIRTNELSAV